MDADIFIPDLYRGDSDPNGFRRLKDSIHYGQLQTNLLNNGEYKEIYTGWDELIEKHVNKGWSNTHFLSFSESRNTAKRFALHLTENDSLPEIYECYDNHNWDFTIICMNSNRVVFERYDEREGIFIGRYKPALKEFEKHEYFEFILINVVEYITKNRFNISIANSIRDTEWLILPNAKVLISGAIKTYENTAVLDMGKDVFEYTLFTRE